MNKIASDNLLYNGSFEEGWEDLPPTDFGLVNQEPVGWEVDWIAPGSKLYASEDAASVIPEIVHKGANQLPADEQLGGPRALITDGDHVLKVFAHAGAFGAELVQFLPELEPGTQVNVDLDVCIDSASSDAWAAEIGVAVSPVEPHPFADGYVLPGQPYWHNAAQVRALPGGRMKRLGLTFEAGERRMALVIYMKSKWSEPCAFFIDNVSVEGVLPGDVIEPEPPDETDWEAAYHALAAEHAALLTRVRDIYGELGEALSGDGAG
jgi:hypothetical protein